MSPLRGVRALRALSVLSVSRDLRGLDGWMFVPTMTDRLNKDFARPRINEGIASLLLPPKGAAARRAGAPRVVLALGSLSGNQVC